MFVKKIERPTSAHLTLEYLRRKKEGGLKNGLEAHTNSNSGTSDHNPTQHSDTAKENKVDVYR